MPVFEAQTNFTGFVQGLILAGTLRFNEQHYSLTVYQVNTNTGSVLCISINLTAS